MPSRITGMDPKNVTIVRMLRKDGRIAYSKIATKVGLSENAVSNRLKRLREDRLIGEIVLDVPVQGWLLLKLKKMTSIEQQSTVESKIKDISINSGVIKEAHRVAGMFDYHVALVERDKDIRFKIIQEFVSIGCIAQYELQENLGAIEI